MCIRDSLEAHSQRSVASTSKNRQDPKELPFRDVHDFVSRTQDFNDRVMPDFADNSGQLFDIIEELGLTTPAALEMALEQFDAPALKEQASQFSAQLEADGVPQLALNQKSSDLILLALFEKKLDQILTLNKGRFGRGRGRPTRLHRLAVRYQTWRNKLEPTAIRLSSDDQ